MSDEVIQNLNKLLDAERMLLMSGDLSSACDLTDRKEELITLLGEAGGKPSTVLAQLQQKARRNHELLEASRAGLQAAQTRLAEVRRAATQLDTYTDCGKLRNLIASRGRLERRA
ncbi:hypothetical protein [Tropicimonas marinistellae]|uniref:hypothetical protein n=1 Tax=Tropicimonas marinistellae TaxID=1739787 RepID=UPI00082C2C32|nr:hypothetical protein [Tropicimonas marinistellae]